MGEGSRERGRNVRGGAWLLRPCGGGISFHGEAREAMLSGHTPPPTPPPGTGPQLCRWVAPAHPIRLPALPVHKQHPAATAVPGSEGPQTKLRSSHAWFMVASAAPGEGSGRDADRKQQIGLCHSSGLGIQGGGRKREVGKGGCYGGCPEERRLCPLKIIIDPHRDERLVCECCFAFTVYKALEHVFLFRPERQPWEALGEAGGWCAHLQLRRLRLREFIWLRPRSSAF